MSDEKQQEKGTEQNVQPTAQTPQNQTIAPEDLTKLQGLKTWRDAELAREHSTLRINENKYKEELKVANFYGKVGTAKLSELQAQIDELHEANDALLEKSEDGKGVKALMAQVKENDKKIKAKEAELSKKEFELLGKEQENQRFVDEVIKPYNDIAFNKSIVDKISERIPGTGKEVDEARKRAIDAVKAAKPTKPEELASIIDLIVPAIKASAPASVGGGTAGGIVPKGKPIELARQAYSKTK